MQTYRFALFDISVHAEPSKQSSNPVVERSPALVLACQGVPTDALTQLQPVGDICQQANRCLFSGFVEGVPIDALTQLQPVGDICRQANRCLFSRFVEGVPIDALTQLQPVGDISRQVTCVR